MPGLNMACIKLSASESNSPATIRPSRRAPLSWRSADILFEIGLFATAFARCRTVVSNSRGFRIMVNLSAISC